MAGIFGIPTFNDDIFNTGAAATGKVGGSYDGWLGDRSEAVVVKPWKQRNLPEESKLELLIVATPTMKQLFKKDLRGLPQLKQYKDKLYDIRLTPTMFTSFNEFKLHGARYLTTTMHLKPRIETDYKWLSFVVMPRTETYFKKTLYGKKMHGLNVMKMALDLIDETSPTDSFMFEEASKEWQGTKQYNDAAKILTFSHSSSFVGQVVWEKANKEMIIVLGDRVYNFCSVPRAIYDGFRKAGSKGRFFNQNIKGLWDC